MCYSCSSHTMTCQIPLVHNSKVIKVLEFFVFNIIFFLSFLIFESLETFSDLLTLHGKYLQPNYNQIVNKRWRVHLERLFGEVICRGHIERSFEEVIWRGHLERSFGGVIWRGHLERSFVEVIWRSHLEARNGFNDMTPCLTPKGHPTDPLWSPDGALIDSWRTPVTLNSHFQWPLQVGSPIFVYISKHYDLRL